MGTPTVTFKLVRTAIGFTLHPVDPAAFEKLCAEACANEHQLEVTFEVTPNDPAPKSKKK
jgi:hypothetical protein